MPDDRVRPFHCGTQAGDWAESNCRSCRKAADLDDPPARCPCDIEQALLEAYCDDGTVSADVARRMGATAHPFALVWPCPEHDPPFVNVGPDGRVLPSPGPGGGAGGA